MDSSLTFWLAIVAIYLLQFFLGKKKPAAQTGQPPELSTETRSENGSSDFHDALSEISRMLGGETQPAETQSQKSPKSGPGSFSQPVAQERYPGERGSRPTKSTFYDEEFDKAERETFQSPAFRKKSRPKASEIADLSALNVSVQRPKKTSLAAEVNRDIHSMSKAKEAFVLAEVLGLPVSKKPWRSR